MGLAGPRKRQKIGPDPNNTYWTRNEASYGRKIMHAQGWSPGSYLGAKDASHSAHFSAASAAPLRMVPKDDNLGIGAHNAPEENFRFGLQALHSLYGRLNGKDDNIRAAEEAQLANLNARMYVDNKWGGGVKFVRGGLLVGDSISYEAEEEGAAAAESVPGSRKRTAQNGKREDRQTAPDAEAPNSRIEEKGTPQISDSIPSEQEADLPKSRHYSKKSKKSSSSKSKRRRIKDEDLLIRESTDYVATKNSESAEVEEENPQIARESSDVEVDKHERRARREERRRKREEKRAKRKSKSQYKDLAEQADSSAATPAEDKTSSAETTTRETTTEPSTPTERSGARPGIGARHTARQRFIKSKNMASMDPRALREILMVTS